MSDLLWALATPVYLLIGTLRHEASHALAAMAYGVQTTEFVFWPSGGNWGHVRFAAEPPWPTLAAPYVVGILVFALCAWLCLRVPARLRALWVNLLIVGVASPAVDSVYNYLKAFIRAGDVAELFLRLGPVVVHGWFLVASFFFAVGIILVLRGLPAEVGSRHSAVGAA